MGSHGGSRAGGSGGGGNSARPSYDDLYIKTSQTDTDAIVSAIKHDGSDKQQQFARDIEQDVYKSIDAWELSEANAYNQKLDAYRTREENNLSDFLNGNKDIKYTFLNPQTQAANAKAKADVETKYNSKKEAAKVLRDSFTAMFNDTKYASSVIDRRNVLRDKITISDLGNTLVRQLDPAVAKGRTLTTDMGKKWLKKQLNWD